MTVDLGLAWWLVVAVAAGVAAAGAVAAWRGRSPVGRGIAGTLAVQGAVIAVAAPFVMDESGMSMVGGALTKEQYARLADADCARFSARSGMLGTAEELSTLADEMKRLVPMFWEAYGVMGTLVPPEDEMPTAMAWMNAMARAGRELEAVRDAARREDARGVDAANARFGEVAMETTALSSKLEMRVCWQP
ncbi:MAG: hypothetical protein WD689_08265 [Gaiellaceae bacterium]